MQQFCKQGFQIATLARQTNTPTGAQQACAQVTDKGNKNACETGYTKLENDASVTIDDACSSYKNDQLKFCKQGYKAAQLAKGSSSGTQSGSNTFDQDECADNAAGFGWIACPIIGRVVHLLGDSAVWLTQQFMAVEPLHFDGALYDTWGGVRELANALFVIVFLVLIFSHLLQINLDAYAVKKMIPRLAAAAILVQFSFVLCGVAVDFGNILGGGIRDLIQLFTHGGAAPNADVSNSIAGNGLTLTASTVLISIATLGGVLELALPVAIMILISVLAMVATLAVRYFLIGILIVASPLAFVAWILPNTERYFNQWLSVLMRLILMYPIIVALLSLAGSVDGLLPASAASGSDVGGVAQGLATNVIRAFVFIGAFLMVPRTFNWAGGIMNEAHGRFMDLADKGRDAIQSSHNYESRKGRMMDKRLASVNQLESGIQGGIGRAAGRVSRWATDGSGIQEAADRFRAGGASNARMTQRLLGPAAIMLTAQSGGKWARDHTYSNRVDGNAKEIAGLDASRDPENLMDAMMHYYNTQRMNRATTTAERNRYRSLRDTNMANLSSRNAAYMTGYTSSAAKREAMMRQMAEKDYLKPNLLQAVTEVRDYEGHAALMRQGANKHFAKEVMLYARRSDREFFNQVVPQGPTLIVKSLSSSAIKNDHHGRNFEVAAGTATDPETARAIAQIYAENLSAAAIAKNFNISDNLNFMGSDKRSAVLRMIVSQHDMFTNGAGRGVKDGVVNQMILSQQTSATANDDALKDIYRNIAGRIREAGGTEADAIAEFNSFLHDLNQVSRNPQTQGLPGIEFSLGPNVAPDDEFFN